MSEPFFVNSYFVLSGKEYVCVLRLHDTVAETKLAQVGLLFLTEFEIPAAVC